MRSSIKSNARRSSSRNFVFITSPVQNPQPTSSSVRCFLGLRVEACHATGPSLGQPNTLVALSAQWQTRQKPATQKRIDFCPAHLHSRRIARDASCPFLPSTTDLNGFDRALSNSGYAGMRLGFARFLSFVAFHLSAKCATAAWSRLLTVPRGISRISPICL